MPVPRQHLFFANIRMNHPDTSIRADPSLAMQEFILVVDDNQITTKLMIRMLLGRGYHVEQALNGETALQIVRTRSPDLILLDILMPGIDGYEVCKTLKADPQTQTIPIIFISSVEQITDKVKAFSVGAADFMQKPFQMPEVLARVENQLQRVRLDRTLKQQQEQLLLQNQRLQREMDDRFRVELALKRQSHTLSRFSNTLIHLHRLSLTDFQSLEELFQEYLQTGCTLLGFSTGMIGRLEEAVYSIQAFYPDSKDWKLGCPFEVKGTFYEQVLREKRTIAFPHPEPGTVPNLPDSLQSIGTYLGTPIFVDHDLYGVLCFFDTQARNEGFESHEWEVIELMAQSIGKFIKLQEAQAKRQQVERELQQAKETAEAANRTKGEFLANMSHELRTPLNVILGFTQIIAREESLTPAIRDSLATITRSGEHLLLLINDVLEMSKIEAGKVVLNPVCFDLHELLSSLEEMLWLKAQAKGIDLQLVWDPTVPHAIQTDEGKLRQILLNLLSNAIKFTPQGQVTLRVTGNGGSGKPDNLEGLVKLAFEVEDTGIG
ncbi:MAG: response regulator, partial [Leptolyngbyaceae cyanobacterium bins.59]|nr:response regulator [Leptolyngbyaceae cyanobacterium bins.59]